MKKIMLLKIKTVMLGVFLLQVGWLVLNAFWTAIVVNAQTAQPQSQKVLIDRPPPVDVRLGLEPQAMAILKAASDRLTSAQTLTFTAVSTYESPSRLGPPLVYTTTSDVTLQRPNKLRVISPGDGPTSEFYYDGKKMLAYVPSKGVAAAMDAPPTIDAALQAAYEVGAVYFPFTDVLVADPYKDITNGLTLAFYMGQSQVIDGITTDMIAIANDKVFAQVWIGATDKLPRMIRAVYKDDPARLRHQVAFSNWKLNRSIAADAFTSSRASTATQIPFKQPEPPPVPAAQPPKPFEPPRLTP